MSTISRLLRKFTFELGRWKMLPSMSFKAFKFNGLQQPQRSYNYNLRAHMRWYCMLNLKRTRKIMYHVFFISKSESTDGVNYLDTHAIFFSWYDNTIRIQILVRIVLRAPFSILYFQNTPSRFTVYPQKVRPKWNLKVQLAWRTEKPCHSQIKTWQHIYILPLKRQS